MLAFLFSVIGTGLLFMTLLFLYWYKYIYDEKDAEQKYQKYKPKYNQEDNSKKINSKVYKIAKEIIINKRLKKE